MSLDDFIEDPPERPRDTKIDEAKAVLLDRFFPADGTNVYYSRQLEIALEDQFFHWITGRALNELARQGTVASSEEDIGHLRARFFWPLRHRYPRRQIGATLGLIREFSQPEFTHAIGSHGELLVDSGFARIGFRIEAVKVRGLGGRLWTKTNHDLDRLISRDGILYGVEVKNQLAYIDQTEFEAKLAMCRFMGIRPMFVARMMPKNYIETVRLAGGFSLILKQQNYPLLASGLARRVRESLGLPVAVIRDLPDGTLRRFEGWHANTL